MRTKVGRVLLSGAALLALFDLRTPQTWRPKCRSRRLVWQKYLIGVEGDFGALTINHNVIDWNDATRFSEKTSWYGTLRGRIGTTTGPALLYLTGGAAWVRLQDGVVPASVAGVPGSLSSKTGTGWTWGGGTEVALDQIDRRSWSRSMSIAEPAITSFSRRH